MFNIAMLLLIELQFAFFRTNFYCYIKIILKKMINCSVFVFVG